MQLTNLFIKLKSLLVVSLIILLQACASQAVVQSMPPTVDYTDHTLFGTPQVVITPEQILSLSAEQKEDFNQYINHFLRRNTLMHERVFDYLEEVTQKFNYETNTLTAEQTLSGSRGNCMSLAVLTTSLANEAEIDIKYQLVDSTPVFYKDSGVVVKGQHVRAKLYEPLDVTAHSIIRRSSLIVDYLPSENKKRFMGNIDHNRFFALYYGNRAVELMTDGDLVKAYWYTRKALEFRPDDAANINTMAIIFNRAGNSTKAEEVYLYGIATASDKLMLLKNYRLMLQGQNRLIEAAEIGLQMAAFDDQSPFGWLDAANSAYNSGEYDEAAMFFQKAVDAAPYLDYGYFGLAKVRYHQGKLLGAKRMLEKAMENTFKDEGRQLYLAKLATLKKELN